jgi:hypothetical protein
MVQIKFVPPSKRSKAIVGVNAGLARLLLDVLRVVIAGAIFAYMWSIQPPERLDEKLRIIFVSKVK